MKNKFKLAICITVVMLCFSRFSLAQFNDVGTPANDKFYKLDNPPFTINDDRRMGVGYFINTNPPSAAFHINANPNMLTPVLITAPNTFLPGEVFRTDGPSTNINAWRLWTGGQDATHPASEKGMIFNYGNNPVVADHTNFSLQASVRDMSFFTLPLTNGTVGTERMRIVGVYRTLDPTTYPVNPATTYPVRAGSVGIGNDSPSSMLHIGPLVTNGGGYRDWMNTGTFYQQNSDNMYVGFHTTTTSNSDAIINWGNNPLLSGEEDRLRFVFTANVYGGYAASVAEGLEIARMVTDGNLGRMGIGDFFNALTNPKRTLDVFDNGVGVVDGRPQLRLSQATDVNFNQGVFTDFQTTCATNTIGAGNLLINPRNTGNVMGFVSINMIDAATPPNPNLSLDVNGQQNIRTVNNDDAITKILVWDDVTTTEGRVKWRDASTIGIGLGTCNTTPTTFPLLDNGAINLGANNNNFYFEGQGASNTNSVGIGYNCSILPAKLSVEQDLIAGGQIGIDVINHNYGIMGAEAIGIQSLVDGTNLTLGTTNIAGKFSINGQTGADYDVAGYFTTNFNGVFASKDWAIFVPKDGGKVQIGGALLDNPPWLLSVYGTAANQNATWGTVSDSLLKTNITPYHDGLSVVRKINPVTFEYNDLSGMPTGKSHVGIIAQQLAPIAPYMVDTVQMVLDTATNVETPVLTMNADAFFYMSINAIKQLDSTITRITLPPDVPTLVSPQNGEILGDSLHPYINFIWNTSKAAVSYYFESSRDSLFVNKLFETTRSDTAIYSAPNAGDTCIVYWHVQAINPYGRSAFSQTRYYHNIPPKIKPKDATSSQYATLSDSTLKTNVSSLTNAIALITQMQPVKFFWDTINHHWLPATAQVGMIAQQMNNIVPQVVFKDSAGYYNIQYGRLVPVLVEGIKELKTNNDSLKTIISSYENRFASIEDRLTQCCENNGNNAKTTNNTTINLELANDAVLYQNIPNPFGEETMINYYIPENTSNAKIIFFDMYGQSMKEVPLTDTGSGNIHVDSKNLASGIYSYSLIINGKVIDTKKMVRNK